MESLTPNLLDTATPSLLHNSTPPPPPATVDYREFGDVEKTRARIYENVLQAAQALEPVSNERHTLRLTGVEYQDPERIGKREQKAAILNGRSLGRRLRGTWELVDNATQQVIDRRRQVLASVPYLTERGTFINNGTENTLKNQQRLLPGVYTRVRDNGEIESHVNIMPGKGVSHRYFLDPERSQFRIRLGQGTVGLMPLLKAMGVTPDQLKEAWGKELFASNYNADDAAEYKKLKQKFLNARELQGEEAAQRQALVDKFARMELDPEVTRRTLGKPHQGLTLDAVLDITRKLVRVRHQQEEPDDRDAMTFQRFLGPEDLFAERLARDKGSVRRQLLWQMSGKGNLQSMPSSALGKQLLAALTTSGLGQAVEEINPAELYDKTTAVSRLGEGGIPNTDAIPKEARSVQPSMFGYVDPLRTPESSRAGVDAYLARGARKGSDGKLYAQFRDLRTGQLLYRTPQQVADLTIGFPGSQNSTSPRVAAMRNGQMLYVPKREIDLELPAMEEAFNPLSNVIPMKSQVKGQRLVMASRMTTQALPIRGAEAPLVQSAVPGTNGTQSFEEQYAKAMGAVRAAKGGIVTAVTPDEIKVRYEDGSEETHDLYQNFPFNRKTFIHQTAAVRPGDRFVPNQLLAHSNYTDPTGTTALGRNARTAYVAWQGKNFEDATVISESYAQKMSSEHMYQHELQLNDRTVFGKKKFVQLFPGKFDRKTLNKLDSQGVIQPGTEVHYGDPLILGATQKESAYNRVHKKSQSGYNDATILWNHHDPGVVTDVVMGKTGPTVVVKASSPTKVGDKLSGRYGDKGVVADILPDAEMPRGADGQPFEVLLNPNGIITRCYDDQTEFLTRQGWKFGRDVQAVDLLACYDTNTDAVLFLKQQAPMHSAAYKGPMLHHRNKVTDFCVTPNHRMWSRADYRGAGPEFSEREASALFAKKGYQVPVAAGVPVPAENPGPFLLPVISRDSVKDSSWSDVEISIAPGDWAEFLGWYIAEGNTTWDEINSEYRVHISQSLKTNPVEHASIKALLERLPFKWYYNEKNIQFHISSKRLAAYLRQFGYSAEKFIPDWLFQQEYAVRQRFLEAYWLGDGSDRHNKLGSLVSQASTVSRQLADDLQRLGVMQGICLSVYPKSEPRVQHQDGWSISRSAVRHRLLNAKKWVRLDYDGMIYCPVVPTGYVVTRRNGRILIAGNTNPAQIAELLLGKIAVKRGQPVKVQDFDSAKDMTEWVAQELAKEGLSDLEDILDPSRDRKIKGIATGNRFFMKLHHTSESKGQGRSGGAYTMEDSPAKGGEEGSKRIGMLETNALLSHGATDTLQDISAVRGQKNDQYWLQFMSGYNPQATKVPHVYQKFVNQLRAAGVNVVKQGTQTHIMAMTDRDVEEQAGDREITNSEGVDWNNDLKEIPGGLFDRSKTGGHGGERWSFIRLHEPLPNPVMEEPIRCLLGLTQKKFQEVLSGVERLPKHGTGPQAIKRALEDIQPERDIEKARNLIAAGRASERDAAVRRLGYLKSCQKLGLKPADYMLSKVPVLPPKFRPVSMMSNDMPLINDANYLYKELFEANANLKAIQKELGTDASGAERLATYQAFKAVVGLGDPISQKSRDKKVKGALQSVFGSSPKFGTLQRKLISTTVDNVGRAVITPNPDLDMDSVGLPEDKAFKAYEKFVTRRLVREGMSLRAAREQVVNKTKLAREILLEEMDHRPVYISRAPVLHKFGILAMKPRLTKGNTLQISPLIVKGFNADFDGDTMNYHVPSTEKARQEALERLLPSRNLFSLSDFKSVMHAPANEYIGGLFHATKSVSERPRKIFRTLADMRRAYERGEVSIDDRVQILES